jgi:hypothetical protein
MSSELFLPSLKPDFVIGGHTKGCNCELFQPKSVTFTPTGELAVCDVHTKLIHIISTLSKSVLKTINLSFISYIDSVDNPSLYHKFPQARGREQRERIAAEREKAYMDYCRNYDKHSKIKKMTKKEYLGPSKVKTEDRSVNSIDFSTDGKLAIGFKMGGVLILKSYKISNVGLFTNMPVY